MSFSELKDQTPSQHWDLLVRAAPPGDLLGHPGGNDFVLGFGHDTIEGSALTQAIKAYCLHDSLYLNCEPYKLGPGFALVQSRGTFLVFRSVVSHARFDGYQEAPAGFVFGSILGAALAEGKRYPYVLSLRTGKARSLTEQYLRDRFADNNLPDLASEFKKERKRGSDEVLLKYIDLLNKAISPHAEVPPAAQ